jgi:hypothetical protein
MLQDTLAQQDAADTALKVHDVATLLSHRGSLLQLAMQSQNNFVLAQAQGT